jgi:hypothetical protein
MPRANRHFLPGYIWHITQSYRRGRSKRSNRSTATLSSNRLQKQTCDGNSRRSDAVEAAAVGSLSFVKTVKSELGFKAAHPDFGWFKPFKPFNRYAPFKPYA